MLIQATSPFVTSLDLDAAISKLQKGKSVISVSPFKRFIWTNNGPVNYDYFNRKRRQDPKKNRKGKAKNVKNK